MANWFDLLTAYAPELRRPRRSEVCQGCGNPSTYLRRRYRFGEGSGTSFGSELRTSAYVIRRYRDQALENLYCLRCNRELEAGQKSVAVYLFAQTVGVRPRQKSPAQRICFCPQCSVSLAMGPAPEGALNLAAWQMIRDIVGADPALTEAAWESLHGIEEGLLPATGTSGAAHPTRVGPYFEF